MGRDEKSDENGRQQRYQTILRALPCAGYLSTYLPTYRYLHPVASDMRKSPPPLPVVIPLPPQLLPWLYLGEIFGTDRTRMHMYVVLTHMSAVVRRRRRVSRGATGGENRDVPGT